jgi:hypothetical protein
MQMQTVRKIHQESSTENRTLGDERINSRTALLERKIGTTSQRKVKSKSEIIITRQQRYWAADLFKQYDLPIPGWLRTRFIINQRRRKLLNDILWEANVGSEHCGQCDKSDDCFYNLHCLWHIVSGGSPCR